jgi:hypothetical protein
MSGLREQQQEMWTLSEDRRLVRLNMPPVKFTGKEGPVSIRLEFDAKALDAMLDRLTRLRVQMFPPPDRN